MPYALYTRKGARYVHPEAGIFLGGIARPVTRSQSLQLKHVHGMVVFDLVQEIEKPGFFNPVRDSTMKEIAPIDLVEEKKMDWGEFRKEWANHGHGIANKEASEKYKIYKETGQLPW